MINNVSSYKTVSRAADKLINNGTLTDYFLVDDFYQALNHFNKSTRLRPEDGKTHYYTGLIHHLIGNGVDAISHMKRAEESFMGRKETKSIADVRKHLRVYQNQYGISTIRDDGSSVARTIN